MIFLNSFCGDSNCLDYTPTAVSDIKSVALSNGIYDNLYITTDLETEILASSQTREFTTNVTTTAHSYSPLIIHPSVEEQVESIKIFFTNEDATTATNKIYISDGTNIVNLTFEKTLGGYIVENSDAEYNYIDEHGNKWICDIVEVIYTRSKLELVYDWRTDISSDGTTFVATHYAQPTGGYLYSSPFGDYPVPYLTKYKDSTTFTSGYVNTESDINAEVISLEVDYIQTITQHERLYDYVTTLDDIYTWDWGTVLYAPFNGNTEAGNVDFTLENTTHIIIKRRKQGEKVWKTIYVQPINELTDFNIHGVDKTARSATTYEYAAVAVKDGIEGTYNKKTIESSFDKIYLIEKEQMYSTSIGDGYCDTTRNVPSTITPLLNNKYPIYIRNSLANYDTGSLSLGFVNTETCPFNFDDKNRVPYQRKVMDFLCDAKPKLLKLPDGRMWLIMVTGNPTDTAENHYANRRINFEWTEIGDCESQRDLYNANLLDVEEDWWVN